MKKLLILCAIPAALLGASCSADEPQNANIGGDIIVEPANRNINRDSGRACEDLCGDGICQEVVCMAVGCPCAETPENCPEDCK